MKFEWDKNKNKLNIEKHHVSFGENIMKDDYDFNNAVVKDYSKEIHNIGKLKIMLNAYKATIKIVNEELKKEVDMVLA